MPDSDRAAALADAYKRGLLDKYPDMKAAVEEAARRGMIGDIKLADKERNLSVGLTRGGASGFVNPIHGITEAIGQVVPGEVGESIREYERQRSEGLSKETAPGFGIGKAVGEAANPINWGPMRAVRGAGTVANIARGVVGGGVTGLTTPTSGQNFGAEKIGQGLMGAVAGGVTAGGGAASAAGVRAVANQIAKRMPGGMQDRAVQEILKRMAQDTSGGGPTVTDAIDLVNKLAAAGKPAALADVTGASTRRLTGNIYRQPGAGRQIVEGALTSRDRDAEQRIAQDIAQHISGGPSMFFATESLLRMRSAAARPLYDVALDEARVVDSPLIRRFLADPTVGRAIGPGMESQRLEALANGLPFKPHNAQYLVNDANGMPIGVKGVPNMGILDAVKRGLDDAVDKETDAVTGRVSQRGYLLNQTRRAFLNELDKVNPDYAAARAAWAGPSRAMELIKKGRTVFQRSPDEVADEFGKLSQGNRDFYRLGVADTLRERIAKTAVSGDEGRALLRDVGWTRRHLEPLFQSPKDYDAFIEKVTTESRMWGTKYSVMGGSATSERVAEDTSDETLSAARTAKIAESVVTGHPWSAIKQALDMRRDLGKRSDPALNEEMAKILFATPITQNMRNKLMGRARPIASRAGPAVGGGVQYLGTALSPVSGALSTSGDSLSQ